MVTLISPFSNGKGIIVKTQCGGRITSVTTEVKETTIFCKYLFLKDVLIIKLNDSTLLNTALL